MYIRKCQKKDLVFDIALSFANTYNVKVLGVGNVSLTVKHGAFNHEWTILKKRPAGVILFSIAHIGLKALCFTVRNHITYS